jgi:hypothetical protein
MARRIKRSDVGQAAHPIAIHANATIEGPNAMSLDVSLAIPECPHCHGRSGEVYTDNITHNLNRMAEAAGIYKHLWRPEEIGVSKASQLIEPLQDGLAKMEADPEKYCAFDAPNGWGKYEHFVPFVRRYLEACKENPDATVHADR